MPHSKNLLQKLIQVRNWGLASGDVSQTDEYLTVKRCLDDAIDTLESKGNVLYTGMDVLICSGMKKEGYTGFICCSKDAEAKLYHYAITHSLDYLRTCFGFTVYTSTDEEYKAMLCNLRTTALKFSYGHL